MKKEVYLMQKLKLLVTHVSIFKIQNSNTGWFLDFN